MEPVVNRNSVILVALRRQVINVFRCRLSHQTVDIRHHSGLFATTRSRWGWIQGSLIAVLGIQAPIAALADAIVPGRCHMDGCHEMRIDQKTSLRSTAIGTLYEVRVSSRHWPMDRPRPSLLAVPFGKPDIDYVLCSTRRPAVIFRAPEEFQSNYLAHLLNPDGQSWYGYNRSSHSIYWATCHNLVGLDFFMPPMVARAIQLGYPDNLGDAIYCKPTVDSGPDPSLTLA